MDIEEIKASTAVSPAAQNTGVESHNTPAPQGASSADQTVAADSSPAQAKADAPKSSLEAVELALQKQRQPQQPVAKTEDAKAGESPAPKAEEGEGDEAEEAEGTEPGKRNAATRIKGLLAEKAELAPKAQAYDQLHGFLHSTGVSHDEFTQALQFLVLAKSDPVQFLSALDSLAAETRKSIGLDALPTDLQAKVDQGVVDEATARELHTQRTSQSFTREQRQREALRLQEERQEQQAHQHTEAIVTAVSGWERTALATDPDFPRLRKLVNAEVVRLLQTEGPPATPEQAVEQSKRALANVKAEIGGLVERKPITTVTGGANGQPVARPMSALDAAEMALRGQRPAY